MNFRNINEFFQREKNIGSMKCRCGLIMLIIYAALLLLLSFFSSITYLEFFGVLFIILSVLLYEVKGGILAAIWLSILLLISVVIDLKSGFTHILSNIGVYFLLAIIVGKDIEERREVEEELKENQNNLSVTLASIGDAVIATDVNGLITRMNKVAEDLTACTLSDAKGRKLSEVFNIINANTRKAVENPVAEVLKTGSIVGLANHTVLIGRDSNEYQIADSAAPIMDNEGELYGVVLVFRDITEKYKQEEIVKESEKKFRTLVSKAPLGIFRTNSKGEVLTINPAMVEILACSTEEEVYERYQNLAQDLYVCAKRRQEFLNLLEEKGEVNKFQYQALRADGAHIWLEMDARIGQNPADEIFIIDGFVSDITERKKAEKKLEENANLLHAILESIQDGICVIDKDLKIHHVNKSMKERFAQYTPIEGRECYKVFHGKSEVCKVCPTLRSFESGEMESEIILQTKGDKPKWLEIFSYPIIDSKSGDVNAVVEFVRDISDRRKFEEQVRYISYHDSLTDLHNRVYIEEKMKMYDSKEQLPLGLIMGDINGLKLINDTYGHDKGDQLLVKAANILRESCREEDILSRWGGDEFVILLPRTSKEDANKIYERIKNRCDKTWQEEIPVSIAIGIAVKEKNGGDLEHTFKKAEDRMYKNKLIENRSAKNNILNALLSTLKEKSQETEEHALRLKELAVAIGKRINLHYSELNRLALLASLHDIGKTVISEEILTKPGKLTEEEWEQIKKHPEAGYRITSSTEEFAHVANDILAHHERWNGTGYPEGLAGEEIPLLARIISIVDAYDVMTNGRSYKKAMSKREVLKEIKDCAGSQFDPELAKVFINIIEEDIEP